MTKRFIQSSLLLSIFALATGCGSKPADKTATQTAETGTEVKKVKENRVQLGQVSGASGNVIRLPGEVEAKKDARLSSARGGFVEKIWVTEGQRVRKGQVIVTIGSREMALGVKQAKAQLASVRYEYDTAKALGDAAPKGQAIRAGHQLELAKAAVEMAELNLERSRVYATFPGVVSKVYVEAGEVTGPGLPVARLVQVDEAEVKVSMSDQNVNLLGGGADAKVYYDGDTKSAAGTLQPVPRIADENTKTFMGTVALANGTTGLNPGNMVTVEFRLKSDIGNRLFVSQDAIVMKRAGNGVFEFKENKAVWRPIDVLSIQGNQVEISGPNLSIGTAIITRGHRGLDDGDTVVDATRATKAVADDKDKEGAAS